jgi:hypothetical protein
MLLEAEEEEERAAMGRGGGGRGMGLGFGRGMGLAGFLGMVLAVIVIALISAFVREVFGGSSRGSGLRGSGGHGVPYIPDIIIT